MVRLVVGMFGLPPEVTQRQQVEIELSEGASLSELIAALKGKIPKLEGSVFREGEARLTENYGFNINGHFYFNDGGLQLQNGDRVALLTLAAGG